MEPAVSIFFTRVLIETRHFLSIIAMSSIPASNDNISSAIGAKNDQLKIDDKKRKLADEDLEDFNEESMPGDDESNEAVDKNDSDVEDDDEDQDKVCP